MAEKQWPWLGCKSWMIMDARAYADPDEACVLSSACDADSTLEDVIAERDADWPGCPIFESVWKGEFGERDGKKVPLFEEAKHVA